MANPRTLRPVLDRVSRGVITVSHDEYGRGRGPTTMGPGTMPDP
jgi:hypothetical protein